MNFIGFDSLRRLYNRGMGMKPRAKVRRRRIMRCLRCPVQVRDPANIPVGWESVLAVHLKDDKYTHLCPKCVIG